MLIYLDYKDDSDKWIGFDADMASIVAKELGVEVKFVEIDWDNKIMELASTLRYHRQQQGQKILHFRSFFQSI